MPRILTPKQAKYFWSKVSNKVDPTQCWEWTGYRAVSRGGYGIVKFWGKPQRAHRVAFYLANGTHPFYCYVCHKCDNPPCCNPDHLYLGNAQSNYADMKMKGRDKKAKGETHYRVKLSDADVESIRCQAVLGMQSQQELAHQYGVCQSTISRLLNNLRRKYDAT